MELEKSLSECEAWKALENHYNRELKNLNMKNEFKKDPERFKKFHRVLDLGNNEEILLDFSRNLINDETFSLMMDLVFSRRVSEKIANMFSAHKINFTEMREVLHTALRSYSYSPVVIKNKKFNDEIKETYKKMEKFVNAVRSGEFTGFSGKQLKKVVNIGIGGSDLGPFMAVEALKPFQKEGMGFYFVSNIDGTHLAETLKQINPEETLFIVASKTFTTIETLVNAQSAKDWLLQHYKEPAAVAKHFIAISTNEEKVKDFGISPTNMFGFWDWVGGRYSLWSPIGMPIALAVGMDGFNEMLDGGYAMDCHFLKAEPINNIPLIMAMLGILYNNFFEYSTYAILPYEQYLWRLPAYLQQLDMESNGKSVSARNERVNYQTGPIVWGQPGTNGQHAFYQLIHQGTKVVPADFLIAINSHNGISSNKHQNILLANFLAQTKALCSGKTLDKVMKEMEKRPQEERDVVAKHRVFEGNRPTNSIVYKKLTPRVLGAIIAMYEHKVFVQGAVWGINSFDQWGVELGKQLATKLFKKVTGEDKKVSKDSSTAGLLEYIQARRQ